MRKVAFIAGLAAIVVAIAVVLWRARDTTTTVGEFRSVERQCLQTWNDALARQRANQIDELGFADVIDREVLPPWRALRQRVASAGDVPERIRPVLARYLAARQIAWEAYAAALRAPTDDAARPLYDAYHQKNAEAQAAARELGPLLGPP